MQISNHTLFLLICIPIQVFFFVLFGSFIVPWSMRANTLSRSQSQPANCMFAAWEWKLAKKTATIYLQYAGRNFTTTYTQRHTESPLMVENTKKNKSEQVVKSAGDTLPVWRSAWIFQAVAVKKLFSFSICSGGTYKHTHTHSHDGMQRSVDCRLLPLRAFGFNLLNPWCKTELIYTLKWRKKTNERTEILTTFEKIFSMAGFWRCFFSYLIPTDELAKNGDESERTKQKTTFRRRICRLRPKCDQKTVPFFSS